MPGAKRGKPHEGEHALILHLQLGDEPVFDFFPGPGGFAQEGETGFEGGIELETTDGDAPAHFQPPMPLHQGIDDGFQGDAVQGIARMFLGCRFGHGESLDSIFGRGNGLVGD